MKDGFSSPLSNGLVFPGSGRFDLGVGGGKGKGKKKKRKEKRGSE